MEHEGGIDTTRKQEYNVCPRGFLSFLSTDYSNSTMPTSFPASLALANAPLLADQCRLDVVSMIESHVVAHHHTTPLKHWGACSAPRLPLP